MCVAVATMALIVATASFLQWPATTPAPQTSDGNEPNAPIRPEAPVLSHGELSAAPDPSDESAPPARSLSPAGPNTDGRLAGVDVVVEAAPTAERLPFVEVSLQTGATHLLARTNEHGQAAFEVAPAPDRLAVLRCGLGAQAQVTLNQEAPTRVLLTVHPRVLVTGQVTDESGTGIADATVVLLPWAAPDADSPRVWRVGRSRADGSFTVGLGTGGRLGAHHRIHGPSALYAVRASQPGSPPATVTLHLVLMSLAAQVSGTVRDATGQPVPFAELEWRSAERAPTGAELKAPPVRTTTDAAGAFLATRLCPGAVEYGVRARGHGPSSGRLQLRPGEAKSIEVHLPPACSLSGVATDETGTPTRATIVVGEPSSFLAVRGETDDLGAFALRDLAPGNTPASARAAAGATHLSPAAANLDLLAGDGNRWDPVLQHRSADQALHGVVVGSDEAPLAGWRVTARLDGGQLTTTTAADGSFGLAIAVGTAVHVRVHAPGRAVDTFADGVWPKLEASPKPVRLQVVAAARGLIRGQVVTDAQLPVPATIQCWHHERAEFVRFTASARGDVLLPDVPAGTVDLLFEYPGHASIARRDLQLQPRDQLDLGTLVLGSGGALHGSVRGPDGLPPDDCQLTVFTKEQGRYEANYSAGSYRFPTLPSGNHELVVQGHGLAAASFSIVVTANTDVQQDVQLEAGVPHRIRVVLPAAAPGVCALALLASNRKMQWSATGSLAAAAASAGSNPERSIEFVAFLAPGTYAAVARAVGGFEASAAVTFALGVDGPTTLRLQRK